VVTEPAAGVAVRDLEVTYPAAATPALSLSEFAAAPGGLTWVTGPNGAGKTTLLATLAGIVPTVIDATVTGSLSTGPAVTPARTGMVLSDAAAHLFATVDEEVAYALTNHDVAEDDLPRRVREALDAVGAGGLTGRQLHTLSGGEHQLVEVAAALAADPTLLLLDEPFEQLDPTSAAELLTLGRARASAGTTVIVATRGDGTVPGGVHRVHLEDGRQATPPGPSPAPVPHRPRGTGAVVLDIQALRHAYGSGRGLDTVDLRVRAGESVALLGPNGSGKTTLIKHALGLLRPDSGQVRVGDLDGRTTPIHRLAEVAGLLFQNPDDQLFNTTVEREVAWGLTASGVARREAIVRTRTVLAELGLDSLADENPLELRSTQRQLVALASVLVRRPRLLLLDEPTRALDAAATSVLLAAIDRRLDQGVAVLTITHDLRFATSIADRWVILQAGRVLADGPAATVASDDDTLRHARLLPM